MSSFWSFSSMIIESTTFDELLMNLLKSLELNPYLHSKNKPVQWNMFIYIVRSEYSLFLYPKLFCIRFIEKYVLIDKYLFTFATFIPRSTFDI